MSQFKEYYYYGFNHNNLIHMTYKKLFVDTHENDKLYKIILKKNIWLNLEKKFNEQCDEQLWMYKTVTQPIKEHNKK